MQTPLWNALQAHVQAHTDSFHTPGHKNGRLVPQPLRDAWGDAIWQYDLTEIPGLDNLAHPEGVLKDSMAGWAAERHCAHVQYLLAGTSLGLKASIYGLCRGKKIFVPRHAHHSIYEGIVLAGAIPVPLPVTYDPDYDIPLGVAPEALEKAMQEHPDCRHLMMVHPTYHGITWRNEELFAMARAHGITTIVDAAHGPHLVTENTPASALDLGADVVIESAHKILPCLTQASIMLIRDEALAAPLCTAVALLHTTSPSYLLMASLEQAGAWLAEKGPQVIAVGTARIRTLEARLAGNPHLQIARKPSWKQDPFKVYLTCPHASGEAIADLLAARGGIAEMTDGRGCLLMLPLDGGAEDLPDILLAVADDLAEVHTTIPKPCYCTAAPVVDCSLAEAYLAPRTTVPLEKAIGATAAELLEAYPPGIPLLLPGERLTWEIFMAWIESGRDPQHPFAILE